MRRDDTSLSPLASIDLFHPLTDYVLCLFAFCVCVLFFVFVFGVVVAFVSLCFVFCFLMNVTVHWTMYRSSTSLLLRLLQHRPLRDLIIN